MTFAFPWILVLLPLALAALRRQPLAAITVSGLAVWRNVPPSADSAGFAGSVCCARPRSRC
jgi:hypothetical protein